MLAHENLRKIDHLIVLMLENRSFDMMLGRLYGPGNPAPRGQPFDGVAGRRLTNPIPSGIPGSEYGAVEVGPARDRKRPDPGPGEAFEHVNVQIFGVDPPPDPPGVPGMQGFVEDYVRVLRERGIKPDFPVYRQIMETFTPEQVPFLTALGRAYAVSDRWFSSVPTMTLPNRAFLHAGTSGGRVLNTPYTSWIGYDALTVFDRLEEAGIPWRVYAGDVPLTFLIHFRRLAVHALRHLSGLGTFFDDCRRGSLPAYTFLEPRYVLGPNDQRPPENVSAGDTLVRDVYQAVRRGPLWRTTLLVILYDEHGGTYDHIAPPTVVPPGDGAVSPEGFSFDRLGVRVPSVLVSPWIEPGTVFRSEKPLDHTSVIRAICERWGLEGLTARDRQAASLGELLTLRHPRKDEPELPRTPPISPLPGGPAASDVQEAIVGLMAAHAGKVAVPPSNVQEAARRASELGRDLSVGLGGALDGVLPLADRPGSSGSMGNGT